LSVGQHWPLEQSPEQQLLLLEQVAPLALQMQVPLEQTPEQQSVLLAQPESPFGIQLTHFPVVLSQLLEQQSESLVQEPAFAIQQVPLLQVWAAEHVETQVPVPVWHVRHCLASQGAGRQVEPQTFRGAQHV
jgi:hypothetical protein